MLKIVLIWGVGLTLLAIVMGVFVILIEHIQHKKRQERYDDLHQRMGLGEGPKSSDDEALDDIEA